MNVSANQETLCRDMSYRHLRQNFPCCGFCVLAPLLTLSQSSCVREDSIAKTQHTARSRKAETIPCTSFINQRTVAFQNCKLLARAEP